MLLSSFCGSIYCFCFLEFQWKVVFFETLELCFVLKKTMGRNYRKTLCILLNYKDEEISY